MQYSTKAVELIGKLPNKIERERYIKLIAEETGFSETGLYAQLGMESQEMYNVPNNEIKLGKIKQDAESEFLSFLLENPDFSEKIGAAEEDFTSDIFKNI